MGMRYKMPGLGSALVFVSVVAIVLRVTPGPLRPVDYFLSGAIATLVACVALFFGVVHTARMKDVFYKRRR
jgi:hypothetical protein